MTQKNRQEQFFSNAVQFAKQATFLLGQIVSGAVVQRPGASQPVITKIEVPSTSTTGVAMTEAELLGGIHVKTPTAAPEFLVPTGTEISDALIAAGITPLVGDSFDFALINLGSAGDIVTLTVDTGVTFVGSVTIDDPGADVNSSGLFRFQNTAANVWVGHRVA